MRTPLLSALLLATIVATAGTAHACGGDTAAMFEAAPTMTEMPMFRCGADFNKALSLAHAKDWKGALAAYEAHLAGIGKWQADSADARAALAYLRRMAAQTP